jgi:hypothetical protein
VIKRILTTLRVNFLGCIVWRGKGANLMVRILRIHPLVLILVLGLLNGLLYTFLVPPWQHYDEPGQFEHAWLIANRPGLPKLGDYDQTMRLEVAISMIEYKFFRGLDFFPDLNVTNGPVWIGASQLDDPHFYYILASLPMRLLSSWNITEQMYAARFISLVLYLLSIVAVFGLMRELAPTGHPLRWMVPISMVLLPGYTDLMTAINNDVGATMLFSLFLWGSVRMIHLGFSLRRLLWVVSTAILCYLTKSTVLLALPLMGLVLLLSIFRSRWCWVPWALLITAISVTLVSILSWGDSSLWIRSSNELQEIPTRGLSAQAPLGRYALQMEIASIESPSQIFQILPTDQMISLRGKTVTLGAWIWATQPINIANALSFYDGRSFFLRTVQIGTAPQFFALTATVAPDALGAVVYLIPLGQEGQPNNLTVFYDGLILVEDARPLDVLPQFDDPMAKQGNWGGQVFHNILRNASVENAGLGVKPWVLEFYNKHPLAIPSPTLILSALLDWRGASWYFQAVGQTLLRTFWAKFGWGHVPLNLPFTSRPYSLLALLTLAGLGGSLIVLWRRRFVLPWGALLFLGIALAVVWGQTILRGFNSLIDYKYLFSIPVARYAYPAIIPTLLVLNAGWLEILRLLGKWFRIAPKVQLVAYFLFFVALDVISLISIAHFYYYGGWVINR